MPLARLLRRPDRPPGGRAVGRTVGAVRRRASELARLSDAALRGEADRHREAGGADRIETFALAANAVRRATGKTFFDVQLQAGLVLAGGGLAEMATGEGKTLVTVLPAYAAAVRGRRVHVATTNAYLAGRDFAEVEPALALLGVSAALLPEENDPAAKAAAYRGDVVYGTGYEFGFDHLRDQLTLRDRPGDRLGDRWLRAAGGPIREDVPLTQPAREATVVDEIDSVLIDEANTPLVIGVDDAAGPPDPRPYAAAADVAAALEEPGHVRRDGSGLSLTAAGRDAADRRRPSDAPLRRPWRVYVEQALRAGRLLRRDVDYVVREGAVALVDQNTGRVFADRKWRDGLHQAVEHREGVALSPENQTVARVSRQRFFREYAERTGLTGTAADAAGEFAAVFGLRVVTVPLNRPSRRRELPTRLFADAEARDRAVAHDVRTRHGKGQPVLIGTRTIDHSRRVSAALDAAGVPHSVLNGAQDADEAAVVAAAGTAGTVTVATNMAGRGTDIRPDAAALDRGGLHVVACESHRSRRVDRQLVGRSGRQGQPGSCQFFASADDELVRHCGGRLADALRRRAGATGEAPGRFADDLRAAQRRAEAEDAAARGELIRREIWNDRVLQTLASREAAA